MVWDTDGVAADERDYVAEHLGEPDEVLVTDETGSEECSCTVRAVMALMAGRIPRWRRYEHITETIRVDTAEAEGFEPPGPRGTLAFKTQ